MPNQHDVDPKTFRCRRCGRGLLAVQYESCAPLAGTVPAAAPAAARGGKGAVPRRALDSINRGWSPTSLLPP